jgi:hypothetical protein
MSLPKQCLYTNKINSSYSKNYNAAIAPVNGTSYNLGETIIINIPTGYNTVMSAKDSLLKFNLNLRGGAALPSIVSYFNRCFQYYISFIIKTSFYILFLLFDSLNNLS